MDSTLRIIVLAVCFAIAAYRLYMKYSKKGNVKSVLDKKTRAKLTSEPDEEEYEPYSMKKKET
jgi:hypothetical protein